MKNIRKFETTAEMENAVLTKPCVLYNEETGLVCSKPNDSSNDNEVDYSKEYLTFVALEDCTFSFTKKGTGDDIQYSLDNGGTWVSLASGVTTPTITTGNKILWKSTITPQTSKGIGTFSSTGNFDVQGNIMSLLFGDEFNDKTDLTDKKYTFRDLFSGNTKLVNAKDLILAATTLANFCYEGLFRGCTNLTTTPELPVTTLADSCYRNMFYGCTSLTTPPELPATTLNKQCYYAMFGNCTSLTTPPELPATTLTIQCYYYMFMNCTNLMFAPELPATTLTDSCYINMFSGCTSMTTAPELPSTTLTNRCYYSMFAGCISLTTAPSLPSTTLATGCYQQMFYGCTKLSEITMLATDISASNCLNNWVYGVASTGTFIKHPDMDSLPTGSSGVPNGWTVEDAVI